ncbi:hypothetical protein L208DRAFT_1406721, partial [Tricholoma matsutake]
VITSSNTIVVRLGKDRVVYGFIGFMMTHKPTPETTSDFSQVANKTIQINHPRSISCRKYDV